MNRRPHALAAPVAAPHRPLWRALAQAGITLSLAGAALPGLAVRSYLTREGERMVLPDNSIATPGWTRLDLALRYSGKLGGQRWIGRLGVDNLADRRAWQEAPYQYDHAYLYPLAPRTWHASVQLAL